MSTATIPAAAGDFDDEFDRITARYDEGRPRFVKSRTEVMTVQDAISVSMGRRRHRTREREV
ncbi:hypothetical protein ACQP2Y_21310 [Actinoplanes sp. CA-051413]|uniref:hypothetical protein n=1 Tax=Actinoplanes sp. CA-051413 TaxID=3239899 RepID=UPI003D98C136